MEIFTCVVGNMHLKEKDAIDNYTVKIAKQYKGLHIKVFVTKVCKHAE